MEIQPEADLTGSTFYPTSAILVSPWIWLTLSILLLCGLLFVSFRKQRAIELYGQGKQYLSTKLEIVRNKSRIRLPSMTTTRSYTVDPISPTTDRRTRGSRSFTASSSASSSSSLDNEDEIEDDEVLPFTAARSTSSADQRSIRYASLQRKSKSMLENLTENLVSSGKSLVDSLGWTDPSSEETDGGTGGWKKLLMGKRDVDREMGRIRLSGQDSNLFELGSDDERGASSTTRL